MKKVLLLTICGLTALASAQQVYELRKYDMVKAWYAGPLHDYFREALIPAMERQGVKHIAVFEEMGEDWPKSVYFLAVYPDLSEFSSLRERLVKDTVFQNRAQFYYNTPEENFPFTDYSTSLYTSFQGMPEMNLPDPNRVIFELRTYESYQEDALRRKVKMFNDSEFGIFEDVGLPPVFFGQKIAGPDMPCLTYMLSFETMEERTRSWERFMKHPEWLRIRDLEEYANTVSEIKQVFLRKKSYSTF